MHDSEQNKLAEQLWKNLLKPYSPPVMVKRRARVQKKIPFLSQVIGDLSKITGATKQLSESVNSLTDSTTPPHITHGLQFGLIGLAALDFLLIPMVYLGALILGEKVTLKRSHHAKWVYSGTMLTLAVIALVIPPIAVILAISAAGLSLLVSLSVLGTTIFELYQLHMESKEYGKQIGVALEEMAKIQEGAKNLYMELMVFAGSDDKQKELLVQLQAEYDKQKKLLDELYIKKFKTDQKIKALDLFHVLDKGLAVTLASLGVAGAILSLFLPPIGLALLTAVSVMSTAYVVGRLAVSLGKWIKSKISAKDASLVNSIQTPDDVPNDSSQTVLNRLFHNVSPRSSSLPDPAQTVTSPAVDLNVPYEILVEEKQEPNENLTGMSP